MKPERWSRIEQIYHAALEREPAERAAFLDEACAGDEALRRQVAALLACDDQAVSFIEAPAVEVAARILAAEAPSPEQVETSASLQFTRQIGAYQILAPLGRGGMGEVRLALDPRLGRKVAIKLLPAEFTSQPERVRRFAQEARAASALNHPNIITIHEIGEAVTETGATHYIVTEYVEGETLRQRISNAPHNRMPIAEAIDIAAQIAAALTAAHRRGITHRDIKPENVMVRRDGYVKVLDFGLAKLTEEGQGDKGKGGRGDKETGRQGDKDTGRQGNDPHVPLSPFPLVPPSPPPPLTFSGMVMGTPRYMSPEQARGEKVDARTDIFSLGVMLYEMVAGGAPFTGATNSEVIAAILRDAPPPLTQQIPETPRELERIVSRALRKDRVERYQSAKELLSDLKSLQQRLGMQAELARSGQPESADETRTGDNPEAVTLGVAPAATGSGQEAVARVTSTAEVLIGELRRHKRGVMLALAALLVVAAAFYYWRSANLNWARAQVPRIEDLAQAERFFEAYDLSLRVREYLPNEPTIARLARLMTYDLTVLTEPPGAQVYLKRFAPDESGNFPPRQLAGVTPINHLQVARGGYVLYIEKEGYAKIERAILGPPPRPGLLAPPFRFEDKLIEAARVPDRMAFVPGGHYRLSSWRRPTEERVWLDDYLIDKYEVTNREYKEFINAGGYLKQQFWKYPFVKDGKPLAWEEAMREFKDRSDLSGPRSWSNQDFPEGKAEHPVTDITWYEAAAYAAFRGKQLPTIFQWENAARGGRPPRGVGQLMPWGFLGETVDHRANFKGQGSMPVASLEFGISHYGCYHMAGNVSEWCLNELSDGFTTSGGSWADPAYLFGQNGSYPGFYSSDRLGFRCALNFPEAKGDQGAAPIRAEAVAPTYVPASEAKFAAWLNSYRYEKTPLESQVIEVRETDVWRREKITFAGADAERAIAYLYLPKNFPRPLQVIHFMPPGSVWARFESLPQSVERNLTPFIKSGRAILAVVLKGYMERDWPAHRTSPSPAQVEYRDQVVNWATDLRRGLDYLETRNDIDVNRIAHIVWSATNFTLITPAVETRYRAVILIGAGLRKADAGNIPDANPINFAPFIRGAKLMIQGRYDETSHLKLEAEPLYKLLREPKRLALFEGGHTPPIELLVPTVNGWLDEKLGPVKHE